MFTVVVFRLSIVWFLDAYYMWDSEYASSYVVVSEFIGDRSTRVFAGHGFVDFSRVIVDHDLQQLIVGVRYKLALNA